MAHTGTVRVKPGLDRSLLSKKLLMLLIVVFGLAFVYVHLKLEGTKLGYTLSANVSRERELIRENLALQAEFIKLKSPERIANIARGLGFKLPTQQDVIYIVEENPLVGERE